MDKRILICIAIILSLGILVFLFFHYFEIVQIKEDVPPTKEYSSNTYLALERWLKETGRHVQINDWFSLEDYKGQEETIVILEPGRFSFSENDLIEETFSEWIKSGYNLIVCLENDNIFIEFIINRMGITVETTPSYHTYTDENTPDFHWRYKFDIEDGKNYYTIKDIHNNIRVVQIEMGTGSLTVLGNPRFMQNYYIKEEKNARLAWELIGERSNETGVLFVRYIGKGKEQNTLFGTLMQRGNMLPVLVSAGLLILFGFWMVIPIFGKVIEEKQKNSRPIKDRFAAEISFLKKYKGLYYYDEAIKKIRGEK